MPISILSQYKIISGTQALAIEARDHLANVAKTYWPKHDLRWAFPYVYALVTHEIATRTKSGGFASNQVLLHWVCNFYELYVLNLNSFNTKGDCESPWVDAFTKPKTLRQDIKWGARSSAAFIVGMYAHIKSDLPRALAYTHLKFGQGTTYDTHKGDFDGLNNTVFPAVMRKMAEGGTQIIPSSILLLPEGWANALMDTYSREAGLTRERETAWQLGKEYAQLPVLQKQVANTAVSNSLTKPKL